jgi:hypothetical protein
MYPTIDEQPALGLTVSTAAPNKSVVDVRSAGRKLPFITPEENLPIDDAHRLNQAIKKIDQDISDIELASFLGLPAHLLLEER